MQNRSAIIELGTRGIRLLVADIENGRIQHVVKSTGDLSNLGKEIDTNGNLSASSIKRVTDISKQYKSIANDYNVDQIHIIATEVVRKAPNRDLLKQALVDIAPLHVLSAQEESLCIFIASTASFQEHISNGQPVLVVDQGGGSTELVLGYLENNKCMVDDMVSLPFGTISLARVLLKTKNLLHNFNVVDFISHHNIQKSRFSKLSSQPKMTIVHGSAIMLFAQSHSPEYYKFYELHGKIVQSKGIEKYIQKLKRNLANKVHGKYKINNDKVTMDGGIPTFKEIAKQYGVQEFILSREGLRFGALLWKSGAVEYELAPHLELTKDKK